MCRHLAYLGPPVTLESLLYDPPHSLVRAELRAAPATPWDGQRGRLRGGLVRAGAVDRTSPLPPPRAHWADRCLPSMARVIASGAVMAAVRSATPPAPSEESGAAPFASGRWLWSLNGVPCSAPWSPSGER